MRSWIHFHKLGWSDGRNVRVEVRWLSTEAEQIEEETKALVESTPDVIVISSMRRSQPYENSKGK